MLILGFDPGGKSGVAIGRLQGRKIALETASVASVRDAEEWFSETTRGDVPAIVGIDAFLSWSTLKGGWRPCDRLLRERYPKARNSVLCTNSAYGAMAIQGIAFALRARSRWPDAEINEVHPKVLMHALRPESKYPRTWPSRESRSACKWLHSVKCTFPKGPPRDEHEFDAALSVWASYRGCSGAWTSDLARVSMPDSEVHPIEDVHFYWPVSLSRREAPPASPLGRQVASQGEFHG